MRLLLDRTIQNEEVMPKVTPTKRAYSDFDLAYQHFNKHLFAGRLPPCLITVRPHRGAYGYFSEQRFGSRDGNEIHDEIALECQITYYPISFDAQEEWLFLA